MPLSNRLQSIADIISTPYQHIWDTCCDHGLLGKALCGFNPDSTIHFVDIAEHIMHQLEQNLTQVMEYTNWQCHTQDVKTLPISQYVGKQLVIIAGVGGELAAEFIAALTNQYPTISLDFIICPVNDTYTVRSTLARLQYGLVSETLIEENNRYYETIYVSCDSQTLLSQVGDSLWLNAKPSIAKSYLNRLISHYEKVSQYNHEFKPALNAYKMVNERFSKH